jgi:hypothetical protein
VWPERTVERSEGSVQIHDINEERDLAAVGLRLSRREAEELIGAIEALFDSPPGSRHEHVSSPDYSIEITVWLEEEAQARSV